MFSCFAFASLVGISIGITSCAIEVKLTAICVITQMKRYKSINQKKRKKHDKMVLLGKFKLNSMEVLISKVLIDSNISHDEFALINNVPEEFQEMKEEIKIVMINKLYIKHSCLIV